MQRQLRFLAAASAALFLTSISPIAARAAVMLTVPATANTPAIPIYVARPSDNGSHPAVLFLHGCAGFDGFLAVAADRLVPYGFVGIALDALGPHHLQTACGGNEDGDQAAAARATLAWMRTQPYIDPDRLAIVGFSMGADTALTLVDTHGAAPPPGVRMVADFYPACEGRDGLVTVPTAIFDGDADQVTPAAPCAAMVKAGTAAGKSLTITTYTGATHGFDVPGPDRTFFGQPVHFDQAAAGDAALQTFRMLQRYLAP
jgi:dienelactone hydrolase